MTTLVDAREHVPGLAADASWSVAARVGVRRLTAITAAGALLGVLVGGVGGRLAMMLLARLNPDMTGLRSDDGFGVGQFTLSGTANLLVIAGLLGVFGAGVYALLRGLMIGPRWIQVASVSLGPAVVVGAMLVHTDGVDFTMLDPPIVAIALFVVIPGTYAAFLTVLAERWLAPGSFLQRAPLRLCAVLLLPWVPVFFMLGAVVAAWCVAEAWRRRGGSLWVTTTLAWSARGALAVVFLIASVDLAADIETLV
jgi:hypothetical protein